MYISFLQCGSKLKLFMKRANISDIAKYANVSKSTVSNYINGRFDQMSPETKSKIDDAVEALDYTPNLSARRLSAQEKCQVICIVIPHVIAETYISDYFQTVLKSISTAADAEGYRLIIYASKRNNINDDISYLKQMAINMIDGFIFVDLLKNDNYFLEFAKSRIPYVCIGKVEDCDDYNYIASNHYNSMKTVMDYLLNLNHKKIALMVSNEKAVTENVWLDVYNKYPIYKNKDYLIYTSKYESNFQTHIYNTCHELLSRRDRPTAFITIPSHMDGLLNAIRDLNLSIPKDISIICMEYIDNYLLNNYNFTRVESAAGKVAEMAYRKLLRSIRYNKETFVPQILELDFIEGDTTSECPVKD